VVLGTASREARAAESQKLLNWGWQAWDAVRLFEAGKEVATVPVWKGKVGAGAAGHAGARSRHRAQGRRRTLKTWSNAPTRWSRRWRRASAWARSRSTAPARRSRQKCR
jgi:D-alanyl-D-alanine carboxypeptidase